MKYVAELEGSVVLDAVRAAVSKAEDLGIVVSVAIVDGGGHLKAFYRMDDAEIAGPVLAIDKAYTAVANRMDTASLGQLAQPGQPLYGIGANGSGRYVIFGGGLPIWHSRRVIGGIGVSGGQPDEDQQCAQAAWQVVEDVLRADLEDLRDTR